MFKLQWKHIVFSIKQYLLLTRA